MVSSLLLSRTTLLAVDIDRGLVVVSPRGVLTGGIDVAQLSSGGISGVDHVDVHSGEGQSLVAVSIALTSEEPTLVIIEGNTFEDEPKSSYNLIDIYAKLADGSSISDNEFSADRVLSL